MNDFFRYKGSTLTLAASIAATWVWAPAIFVSSGIAYSKGLAGLLWFLIPNALTLVLFGWVVSKLPENRRGLTFKHVFDVEARGQQALHSIVSLVLLICSTVVQLIGIHTLFAEWFGLPKLVSCIGVSIAALALVFSGGLKSCILTDVAKYALMLGVGLVCAVLSLTGESAANFEGMASNGLLDTTLSFGLITAVGLLCAPYVDQTFWQRAFCIERGKQFKTFVIAALLFALVPLSFGVCGFFGSGDGWTIAKAFTSPVMQGLLGAGVLSALVSTMDSNLCAISSMMHHENMSDENNLWCGRWAMVMLLLISGFVFLATDITITALFLLYGTIRTCAAIPTILFALDRYNTERLFYATLTSMIAAPLGYWLASGTSYQWCFTVLGAALPLLGYSSRKK